MTSKVFALLFVLLISHSAQAALQPKKKLPPCEDTPNCVSTQAPDRPHYVLPLRIVGEPNRAWQQLRELIKTHDRMVITHETEDSLHAEATSLVMSFVDDIDAFMDKEAGVIHIRSASRLGHDDFGVNRKRIEALRAQLRKLNLLV